MPFAVKGQDRLAADLRLVDRLALADDRFENVRADVLQLLFNILVGGAGATVQGIAENPAPPLPLADFLNRGKQVGDAVQGIPAVGRGNQNPVRRIDGVDGNDARSIYRSL